MSFEDIIDRVKTRPEIWQRAHPLYKNKMLRLRIWNQMSKELDTESLQLKKSWKYLTDQYRREFKKIKALGPYEGKQVPCGWAYYERLAFLKDEMETRRDRRPTRIPASSDSDTGNDAAVAQESGNMTQETFPINHESFQQDEDDNNYESTWNYSMSAKQKQAQPGPSAPSTSGVSKADLILRRLQSLSASLEKSRTEVMGKDEDFMFFMSILPMVRTLSPVRKLQLRGKINEWLLQTLSEADPLNNIPQYVPIEETEDNKDAVMKQIMEAEDEDS